MIVAYRMAEVRNFFHIVKVAPKSDVFVLLTCFFLTVFFDMVIGVGVGVVLAALLFMRRMAEFTSGKMLELHELHEYQTAKVVSEMPREVLFYQIAGPLFFGATQRAIEALSTISDQVKVVVFDLRLVPVMDVSGLIALETTIAELKTTGRFAIFTGVTKPVKELISKSPHINQAANVAIFDVIEEAVTMAKKIVKNSV
jgi:SulP family sulfate permease